MVSVMKCPNCGASLQVDHEKRTTVCNYCKSAVVTELPPKPAYKLCPRCETNIIRDGETLCNVCKGERPEPISIKPGGYYPISRLRRGAGYGGNARKIYEACCDIFGWNKWKSDQFILGKPFYAKKVDPAGRSVWFIVCPSYIKPYAPDAPFNWIKDDGETIIDLHKDWRDYHNDGADKIVFVTTGNGWEFSGIYSHFNGDVGVYVPFNGGRYKRIPIGIPNRVVSKFRVPF
jgi:DNA-directed RNA polymerase subunit RPC12/RpoP